MTANGTHTGGWFEDTDPLGAIKTGRAETPAAWPALAVENGFVDSTADYYDRLHEATLEATREEVRRREQADDQQLKHAIRAMDDCERTANELAERVAEWAGTLESDAGTGAGLEYVQTLATEATEDGEASASAPVVSLAGRVVDLQIEADELRGFIEQRAPTVAPNLTALAGPILAARLISLAGGLEALAKKPSGTVQVLGAEEALFAHLRGHAPSPKHGIIFMHEAVRGTRMQDRGSAARALAGKLSIAARIDHYSGDYRPALEAEFRARMKAIRARAEEERTDE